MANIQEVVLSVPGVSCEHCVKAINSALSALPGVETVSTDIPTKSVHLCYDADQLSLEQIETTLDDEGYAVTKAVQPMSRTSGKLLNLL
jgi:copper chaperone